MSYIKTVIVLMFTIWLMTGIWMVDLASSALAIEKTYGIKLIAQSLTIQMSPNTVYHLGLIFIVASFMSVACMLIYELNKLQEDK